MVTCKFSFEDHIKLKFEKEEEVFTHQSVCVCWPYVWVWAKGRQIADRMNHNLCGYSYRDDVVDKNSPNIFKLKK